MSFETSHIPDSVVKTEKEKVDAEKALISEILQSAVFEHDQRNFAVFRGHISYGSKFLDCYVHKDIKEVGVVIEAHTKMPKKENETTLIYKALQAFLRGVANRLGENLKYILRTENEKLTAWAKTSGNEIFN